MHRIRFDVNTITLEDLEKGERAVVKETERAHALLPHGRENMKT